MDLSCRPSALPVLLNWIGVVLLLGSGEVSAAWLKIPDEPEAPLGPERDDAVPRTDVEPQRSLWIELEPPAKIGTAQSTFDSTPLTPLQVGFSRDLPPPYRDALPVEELMWSTGSEGGMTAVIMVHSPEARALRLAIAAQRLPLLAELRLFGQIGQQREFGPFTAGEVLRTDGEWFWSPVVEGETVGLEIHLPPGVAPSDLWLALPAVSHLVASPYDVWSAANASCDIDVACHAAIWGVTAASVARLIFTVGRSTYTCTGTLVRDSDTTTSVPYFLTARHCVGTQQVASTVATFWFHQSSTCGGSPSGGIQLGGGATLLSAGLHPALDYALLRLNRAPPAGTTFANWITEGPEPIAGEPVVGISHPAGGPKTIAFGTVRSAYNNLFPNTFDVLFTEGGTSAGSSGSGFFAPQGQYLTGILSGGAGTCAAPPNFDIYLAFSDVLPIISRWLLGTAVPPTRGE